MVLVHAYGWSVGYSTHMCRPVYTALPFQVHVVMVLVGTGCSAAADRTAEQMGVCLVVMHRSRFAKFDRAMLGG